MRSKRNSALEGHKIEAERLWHIWGSAVLLAGGFTPFSAQCWGECVTLEVFVNHGHDHALRERQRSGVNLRTTNHPDLFWGGLGAAFQMRQRRFEAVSCVCAVCVPVGLARDNDIGTSR